MTFPGASVHDSHLIDCGGACKGSPNSYMVVAESQLLTTQKALILAIKVLEEIMKDVSSYADDHISDKELAKEALTEINKILSEEPK